MEQFKSSKVATAAVLAIVYKRIFSRSWQAPVLHRGDTLQVEFLRAAVAG